MHRDLDSAEALTAIHARSAMVSFFADQSTRSQHLALRCWERENIRCDRFLPNDQLGCQLIALDVRFVLYGQIAMSVVERQRCSPRLERGRVRLLLASGVVFGLAACGAGDRNFGSGSAAGAGHGGTAGNEQGGANVGGTNRVHPSDPGGQAGDTGGAGEGGGAGEAGAAGASTPICVNDSFGCADNTTPSKCVDGSWIDQEPCPASKPACSNGFCAAAAISGGIVTVSDGVLETSSVRLVDHGLEYTQTTCGTVGTQKVCVTGGIRP